GRDARGECSAEMRAYRPGQREPTVEELTDRREVVVVEGRDIPCRDGLCGKGQWRRGQRCHTRELVAHDQRAGGEVTEALVVRCCDDCDRAGRVQRREEV